MGDVTATSGTLTKHNMAELFARQHEICTVNSGDCSKIKMWFRRGGWRGLQRNVRVYLSKQNVPDYLFIVVQTNSGQHMQMMCSMSIPHLQLNNKQGLRVVECVPADIRLEAGTQPHQVSCPSSSALTWGNLESLMRIPYILSEITHWNITSWTV